MLSFIFQDNMVKVTGLANVSCYELQIPYFYFIISQLKHILFSVEK